jgi:hypothetical protein
MDDRSQMTLARLGELLDAYGADSERWPPEEQEAACVLLAQSAQAQRRREASAQLDALLNLAPAQTASPALLERILAAAPQGGSAAITTVSEAASSQVPGAAASRTGRSVSRRARAWRYIGAVLPLAAAAAFVLWLLSAPAPTPERTRVTMAELGSYDVPTDALLATPGLEALDSVPSFGCTGSGLGCLDPEPLNKQSALDWETRV